MKAQALKQNKWVRRGIVAVAVLLGLWLLLWLAVPPIAKSQIQKIASEQLGRQVTLERVDFKPWSLELALEGLRIASADQATSQVEVRRVYVDAELQSLFRLAPVIDALRIEAPNIRFARTADGSYDFDDILARFAQQPKEPEPDAEPARFALYNIAVTEGAVHFDDRPVGREHLLRDLSLAVPFISSLKSQREVNVEPHLAFVLNDSPFDSTALSTPFTDSRKTEAQLDFEGFDLAPYLGYVPKDLPLQPKAGVLGAKLKLGFEQGEQPVLRLSGEIDAKNLQADDAQGRELLKVGGLRLVLADVQPLAQRVHLSEVAVTEPKLIVARDAEGRLNVVPQGGAAPAPAPAAPTETAQPWQAQVDRFVVQGGEIGWRDAQLQPAAAVDVKALQLEVQAVQWPMTQPARLTGSFEIDGAPFRLSGEGTDKAATLRTEVTGLPLSLAASYTAGVLEPEVAGKLDAQIEAQWNAPDLKLAARQAAISDLALTQGKTALASAGRFELGEVAVDLKTREVRVGSVSARNPKVRVERDDKKRWMYEGWLKTPAGGKSVPTAAAPAADGKQLAEPPWKVRVDALALENGTVAYVDKAVPESPVEVEISALQIKAGPLVPESATVSALAVSGRLGAVSGGGRRAAPGRFDYQGNLVLQPLSTEGRLVTQALPAHAFKAYYGDALNIDIRRAYANFNGRLAFAQPKEGMRLKLAGDTAVEDFRANSAALAQTATLGARRNNDRLLSWKALSLRGLQVDMAPAAPMRLDVRETTLTDFYARVIVEPSGRLNLQNLTREAQAKAEAEAANKPAPASERGRGGSTVTTNQQPPSGVPSGMPVGGPLSADEQAAGGGAQAAAAGAPGPIAVSRDNPLGADQPPVINFGPVSVVNGTVDFTDLFIQPNYSADLTELTGRLSAFSSKPRAGEGQGQTALADLELRGKAQQTAALEISGKLNPLADPLELDVTARMRDLDLPPLSPYSVRYAGHGIERGKLSMDVNYKVAPDGRLTATNKLVLNQLQFGERVEGAPASLPVRLAVALLADRNGVIDVDLPLSGSLNDPQFRVAPLVWKAIVNLVTKAVTAPFSLLTGGLGGGGGGDSSTVPFAPGSAVLSDEARQSLDKVVKALTDRPGLRMTVVGVASLDKEREGYRRQRLREMAQSEKRRAAVRANQDPRQVPPLTDAEYPALLEAAYKRSDITKPRNMIGLARELPLKEMEDLLMASIPVDAETIRGLAVARGAAVRDYLLEKQLAGERLFLGNVRTEDGKASDWKPGAELKLDMR